MAVCKKIFWNSEKDKYSGLLDYGDVIPNSTPTKLAIDKRRIVANSTNSRRIERIVGEWSPNSGNSRQIEQTVDE